MDHSHWLGAAVLQNYLEEIAAHYSLLEAAAHQNYLEEAVVHHCSQLLDY